VIGKSVFGLLIRVNHFYHLLLDFFGCFDPPQDHLLRRLFGGLFCFRYLSGHCSGCSFPSWVYWLVRLSADNAWMLFCFTPNMSPLSLLGILYGQSFGPHFLVIGRSVFRPIDPREPLLSPAPRLSSVDSILCKILFVDCSVDYSVSGTCLRRIILFQIFVWPLFRLQPPVLGLVADFRPTTRGCCPASPRIFLRTH
jgi:hypothetical protein